MIKAGSIASPLKSYAIVSENMPCVNCILFSFDYFLYIVIPFDMLYFMHVSRIICDILTVG